MKKGPRGLKDSSNKSLVRGLVLALLKNGTIQTSEARATLVKITIDSLINQIKNGNLNDRRRVAAALGINHSDSGELFAEVSKKISNRTSGFVRVIKIGPRRGDSAPMVKLELISDQKAEQSKKKAEESEVSTTA